MTEKHKFTWENGIVLCHDCDKNPMNPDRVGWYCDKCNVSTDESYVTDEKGNALDKHIFFSDARESEEIKKLEFVWMDTMSLWCNVGTPGIRSRMGFHDACQHWECPECETITTEPLTKIGGPGWSRSDEKTKTVATAPLCGKMRELTQQMGPRPKPLWDQNHAHEAQRQNDCKSIEKKKQGKRTRADVARDGPTPPTRKQPHRMAKKSL